MPTDCIVETLVNFKCREMALMIMSASISTFGYVFCTIYGYPEETWERNKLIGDRGVSWGARAEMKRGGLMFFSGEEDSINDALNCKTRNLCMRGANEVDLRKDGFWEDGA